jgi:signal transduction histidine kinase
MPPSPRQVRLAAVVAIALVVVAALTIPFATIQLAPMPAFVPVAATALVFAHLMTATLLFTLSSVLGSRSLVALATGYFLLALLMAFWGLTFPGAFSEQGLFGAGLQTTVYLYASSRFVLPCTGIVYAVLKSSDAGPMAAGDRGGIFAGIAAAMLFAGAMMWLATQGAWLLPPIMVDAHHGNGLGRFFGIAVVGLDLFAMAFLWRRRMSVLDLWLVLTLWVLLVEVAVLSTTKGVRFNFNWYSALTLEYVSTVFILAGLLSQTLALYARLTLATDTQRRERESRHLALSAALGAVAHETYQPITAIAANSSAGLRLLRGPEPDLVEVRAIFNDIIADTRRTSDAIDAIRAIFKVNDSAKAPLDVESLVQETLSLVRAELRAHNVTADARFETDLPTVAGNREQLQQVLLNLIANAIEAMDYVMTRPRVIQVSAARDGDEVLVMLADSGPGIDPAQTSRIFDPFVTTKAQASGLGLPICRSIIEAHSGRLRAEPAEPHGSVFAFTLPVAA